MWIFYVSFDRFPKWRKVQTGWPLRIVFILIGASICTLDKSIIQFLLPGPGVLNLPRVEQNWHGTARSLAGEVYKFFKIFEQRYYLTNLNELDEWIWLKIAQNQCFYNINRPVVALITKNWNFRFRWHLGFLRRLIIILKWTLLIENSLTTANLP